MPGAALGQHPWDPEWWTSLLLPSDSPFARWYPQVNRSTVTDKTEAASSVPREHSDGGGQLKCIKPVFLLHLSLPC